VSGLTVTGARLDGVTVGLRAEAGVIVGLGPDVRPAPGDRVLDAVGATLLPGMVNAHTHAAMTLFRSWGDDLPLRTWLEERIWPAEARLSADDVYWGTRLACLEMIRSGTTRFVDMYWHPEAVARAVRDSGLRATVCAPLIDRGSAAAMGALRDAAESSLEALDGFCDRVTPALGPHATYTVSAPALAWIGRTAAERGVGIHVHLAETAWEVRQCREEHGVSPAVLLDRHGLLGAGTVAAHGCWLDDDDLALLAERGATIATCPVSNMKLAVGHDAPYRIVGRHTVALGLGTDGPSSNNSLDLFQDVKLLALLHKFLADDPAAMPATEALAIARGQRSPLLGGQPLGVGAPADFLLARLEVPELVPGELDADLVYAATGAVVDTTVVAGEVLMTGRRVEGAEEVLAEVRARAERVRTG